MKEMEGLFILGDPEECHILVTSFDTHGLLKKCVISDLLVNWQFCYVDSTSYPTISLINSSSLIINRYSFRVLANN